MRKFNTLIATFTAMWGLCFMSLAYAEPIAAPSGASAVFTSLDPTIRSAVERMEKGLFTDAEQSIHALGGKEADELREVIARTRRDFNLDEAAIIEKLKPTLGNVTSDDIARWRESGELQHRVIDGKTWYFRREPANLYRFCDEAIARRDAHAKATGKVVEKSAWLLEDHLADIVAAAETTGDAYIEPVRHRVHYSITIPAQARGAKAGSKLRVWLPYPQDLGQPARADALIVDDPVATDANPWVARTQHDVRLIRMSPDNGTIAPNAAHRADGGIDGAPQRTVYFEQVIEDPAKPTTFAVEFEYTAYAYYPQLDDAKAEPLPKDFPSNYLSERLPHISFTPELRAKVKEIVGDEINPLARARKIYQFVDSDIRYCAEVEYTTIPSFSQHALTRGRGDCGVQAMLFITLCRAAGIPARWQSGWETKKSGPNMHDWAEFYVAPWGWLPADVSYGTRKEGPAATNEKVRDFYFGHQDSYRWIVNLDYGSDLHPPVEGLRAEPADFQKGEVELDGRNLYYDDWGYSVSFDWR